MEGSRRSYDSTRFLELARRSVAAGGQDPGAEEVISSEEGVDTLQTPPGVPPRSKYDSTEFLRLAAMPLTGSYVTPAPEMTNIRAFGSGLKVGLLDPLTFVLGRDEADPNMNGIQKGIRSVGLMAGLGLSFVPISIGTGLAMRGVGLTAAKLGGVEMARFIRYTTAGGLQFAGASENLEEVPKNLAIGIAFGGVIEGAFLVKALSNRGASIAASQVRTAGEALENRNFLDKLANEIEIAPTQGQPSVRVVEALKGIADEEMTVEMMLADLTKEHVEAVRIQGVANRGIDELKEALQARVPSASIMSREIIRGMDGTSELFIHNPIDPTDALTAAQRTAWQIGTGPLPNQEVIYGGKSYKIPAVSEAVEPGRVQIQDLTRPGLRIAPMMTDVIFPNAPKMFTDAARRRSVLAAALADADKNIGFVIPTASPNRVQRGRVDTSTFAKASSVDDWIKTNWEKIKLIPGANTMESALSYARANGIKGVLIQEEGLTKEVRIFDQTAVRNFKEPPVPAGYGGVEYDAHVMMITPQVGSALAPTPLPPIIGLESFVPSWRNNITMALKEAKIPEREIRNLMDIHAASLGKRASDLLLDPETKAMLEAAEARFTGGCI